MAADPFLDEATNSTSSVNPFLFMDSVLATNDVICNLIGLPLNVLTAAFILFSARLHQTRNITWLGVAFSNVLILSTHLVEFCAYQFQCETCLKIIVLMAGLPYASLMLNLFLSLLDRYVSIVHSTWYKRNVTIGWIVSGQIGCFSIFCILMKGPYLIELIQLPSKVTTIELKFLGRIQFAALLLCIFGQIFFYFKIKYYFCLEKDVDISLTTNKRSDSSCRASQRQTHGDIEQENSFDGFHHKTTAPEVTPPSLHFIQIGGQTISRLELKAARHALNSVTLLLVFAAPAFVTLYLTIRAGCLPSAVPVQQNCSAYLWTFAYTRGFMLIYPVVNPILFTARSRDLLQFLNRRS